MAWIMAFSCLFGFTAAGFIPVLLGAVLASSPVDQAGALTSALNIFLIGGSLLGPLAFGGVAATFGYSAAFVALAALCTAGALCCAISELGNRVRTPAMGSIT